MPGEAAPLFSDAPSAPSVTARRVAQPLRLTATAEVPTGKYYRTVIRDSYPGWASIRAKAAQEVCNALKLRHRAEGVVLEAKS